MNDDTAAKLVHALIISRLDNGNFCSSLDIFKKDFFFFRKTHLFKIAYDSA